jgi:acetyl-CoA carboxylase carboxyltransferase component
MSGDSIPQDWAILIEEFERRRQAGRVMGGEDKLARRSQAGKLNARELINLLVDEGSFMELGTLVGGVTYDGTPSIPADALVGGLATIDGRPVVLAAEDFTSKGGSIGHGTSAKRVRLAKLALQEQVPYILMLDGAGARVTNSLERHPYAPSDLIALSELMGKVPTVAMVYGSSAGHGALSGVMMDFVVMLEGASLFSAGPPLVAAALGEHVTKEELGSAHMHASVSGVVHNLATDEQDACRCVRQYLSHLPQNAWQAAPTKQNSEGERRLDDILAVIPRDTQKPYDIRQVIQRLVDEGEFMEIQPLYGKSIVTGLAWLGGQSVAVVANQPMFYAGSITHDAAEKASHFIDRANAYHLPVIFLADNPGIMSGTKAERDGTLRSAARMYAAQAKLTSPKLHVTLRKAFGFGSSLMAMNPFDEQTITLALPGITLGGIPAKGGGNAANVDEQTAQLLAEAEASGSWTTGDTMAYDEIIDPREMRNALLKGLKLSQQRMANNPEPVATPVIRP